MSPALPPIDVRRYGAGEPRILLLHGGPGGAGYMRPLARELSDEFAALEPLQRAAGIVPLTVAQHVEDLDGIVRTLQGPAILVGSSWGAMLALSYAARFPSRVSKIVAIGCGTFDRASRKVYHDRLAAMASPEIARERDELRRALGRADDRNSRLRVFERLVRIDTRLQSFDPLTDDLEIVNLDIEGRQETWTDVLRLQDDGVQPAEFAAITAPVVMLHGDTDPHPGTMIRDSLSPFITGLQYIEFPRCGHIPWIERQARDAFLRELRSQLRDALGK